MIPDFAESLRDILISRDGGEVGFRSDQNEIVVHDGIALQAFTLGEEFQFLSLGVDEHDVGIPAPSGVERLARTLGDNPDGDAGLLFDDRQEIFEKAGVLGGRG